MCATLAAVPARANDSAMGGQGGNLVPLKETRVRMESEHITLRSEGDRWYVDARYQFHNPTSDAVDLQMGFPETHCHDDGGDCVMDRGDVFEGMQTRVRGQQVPRRTGSIGKRHKWAPALGKVWLYDVRFEPGERVEITHRYNTVSGTDVQARRFTTYVTRTGALWAGPIGLARFTVNVPAAVRHLDEPGELPRVSVRTIGEGPRARLELTYEKQQWVPRSDFHTGYMLTVNWYERPRPAGPLAGTDCGASMELLYRASEDPTFVEQARLPTTAAGLRLCRNLVYAARGRRFKDDALNRFFYGSKGFRAGEPPYLAFQPNPLYSDALLTRDDRRVLKLIRGAEAALHGGAPVEAPPRPAAGDPAPPSRPSTEPPAVAPAASEPDTAAPPTPPQPPSAGGDGCGIAVRDNGLPGWWALLGSAWALRRRIRVV